jgi:acyl carrier protein
MEIQLLTLLREQILAPDALLDADSDLFAAGLDSMGIMQLVLAIEDHFGIALEPTDLSREHFQSATRIAALLRSKS